MRLARLRILLRSHVVEMFRPSLRGLEMKLVLWFDAPRVGTVQARRSQALQRTQQHDNTN
jgi:hypothetical protein